MSTTLAELVQQHTRGVIDRLGCDIDEHIAPLVALLMGAGIETVASCEGHLTHGLPHPWVDVHGNSYNRLNDLLLDCFAGQVPRLKIWKFEGEWSEDRTHIIRHDRQFRLEPIDPTDVAGAWAAMQELVRFLAKRQDVGLPLSSLPVPPHASAS